MCIWTLVQSGIVNISKSLSKQETIKINLVTLILLNCNLFSHIEKKEESPAMLASILWGSPFQCKIQCKHNYWAANFWQLFFKNSFKIIFQYNVLDTVIHFFNLCFKNDFTAKLPTGEWPLVYVKTSISKFTQIAFLWKNLRNLLCTIYWLILKRSHHKCRPLILQYTICATWCLFFTMKVIVSLQIRKFWR